MPRIALLAAAAALVATTACRSIPTYDYKVEPDPRGKEIKVGPLDVLSIVVWKNKDLSADVTVRPDGIITLPLIGDLSAAERTPSDIQKEVTKRYADFVKSEEIVVSVVVAQVNSYYFTVSGNVERAGLYHGHNYMTVVEAIAMAGGPNRFAGDGMYIVRGTPPRKIPIDIPSATNGDHPEMNVVVLRGDVLIVP